MKKVIIADGFSDLTDLISDIHSQFEASSDCIKNSRNIIKVIDTDNYKLCVKSFVKFSSWNRIMYSFVRKSKAERSFLYGKKLLELSIDTPQPVAFVEIYNSFHIMTDAYYISYYDEYKHHMGTVLDGHVEDRELIMKQFIDFTLEKLHANGVDHKDFNGANVLVHAKKTHEFSFSLIDLNRIHFRKPLNYRQSIHSLRKICSSPIYLTELAKCYAEHDHIDEDTTIYQLLFDKYFGKVAKSIFKKIVHPLR